jgi:hypothetical protein
MLEEAGTNPVLFLFCPYNAYFMFRFVQADGLQINCVQGLPSAPKLET